MDFHRKNLDHLIALLNTQIRPELTIIDGIYAMERGPDFLGTPHRMNLIIAGKNTLSCDIIGSTVLGIDPSTVEHLKEFVLIENRSLDLNTIDVQGENIEDVIKQLEWDRGDLEEIFREANIKGVTFQGPGKSFCSGCIAPMEVTLALFCKDNPGTTCDNIEICSGPEIKPKEESKKVILVGDCSIRANRDLEDAVRVKGCPPMVGDAFVTLTNHALDKGRARKIMMVRLLKKIADKMRIYDEDLTPHKHYGPPEFDRAHF